MKHQSFQNIHYTLSSKPLLKPLPILLGLRFLQNRLLGQTDLHPVPDSTLKTCSSGFGTVNPKPKQPQNYTSTNLIPKSKTTNPKPKTPNQKSKSNTPKPEAPTPILKPQSPKTPNPKPQTERWSCLQWRRTARPSAGHRSSFETIRTLHSRPAQGFCRASLN